MIASRSLSAAGWSRWAVRSHSAPPEADDRFLERLVAIGKTQPGQILLPTSDETAWLYAAYADLLKRYFCLYQPPLETIRRILDKQLLALAASNAGLPILPSWEPRGTADLEKLAPTLEFPILIKPRTHVHRIRSDKGVVVRSTTELLREYSRFLDRERAARTAVNLSSSEPDPPILQPFVNVGSEGVLSVTGFIDRKGENFVTRHSKKVFQRSRPVGVGVCFESMPPITHSQTRCAACVTIWAISGSLRSSFCGSGTRHGLLSASIHVCLIKLEWTSDAECHFQPLPVSMLPAR